jgi:hypothetical protein
MPSASDLHDAISAELGASRWATPMAALAVRFLGRGSKHLGHAVASVVDGLLEKAPDETRWGGYLPKKGGPRRVAKPKPVARRRPLIDALAALDELPSLATMVYVDDGEGESVVPRSFGLWLGLVDPDAPAFCAPGGFLMVGWPMARLEDPDALVAECEPIVRALGAEVAWLGAAVWLAPSVLINASSNRLSMGTRFHARHPQVGAPSVQAQKSPLHDAARAQGLDPFAGFYCPAWTMWLQSAMARRVRRFPGVRQTREGLTRLTLTETVPFAMDEATYDAWRAGWETMAPVKLSPQPPTFEPLERRSTEHTLWHGYLGRFEARSHAAALEAAEERVEQSASARERQVNAERDLAEALQREPARALSAAERLADEVSVEKAMWALADAFPALLKGGHASVADVERWLRRGLDADLPGPRTQLAERMANAAVAAKLEALAFEALMAARPSKKGLRVEWVKRLERISPVRRLRRDPRWASLA